MASSLAVFPLVLPSVGSSSAASNITQLRGHFPLHPLLFHIPFPCSYLVWEAVCTPDSPKRSLLLFLSRPVALKSTPRRPPRPPYFHPFPRLLPPDGRAA
ncbi:hypothetical protein CgunFtcFv8_018721 [Champsocephalus gunnari]|uniref:Secreted protein n=1 Tax=Champsocephalus gunnari TaxID=52237 RepID=A0AAN8GUN6_CHAGU|nr:hypothetical protein CgunFtcFv8_018721 [Champsocephalus gunnari]